MAYVSGGGPIETAYIFIDAGCLRETVREISRRYLGDESSIVINWMGLRRQHQKAFVYDAVSARGYNEDHIEYQGRIAGRMEEYARIKALDGFHMQLGDLRGKKSTQKKVDVQITVDMLMHTVRGNMSRCTLLTGDSDFQPLLEALTREGMFTTLWHPRHAPADLTGAADSLMALDMSQLADALLRPDGSPLLPRCGHDIRRPYGELRHDWYLERHRYEIREADVWTLERFYPDASASSENIRDVNLQVVIEAAKDLWRVDIPELQRGER